MARTSSMCCNETFEEFITLAVEWTYEEAVCSYKFEGRKQFADTCLKRSQIPGPGDVLEFYIYRH